MIAGLMAYTFWGLIPFYFKATDTVPALEILAHRIAWSVPFGALIIIARRQWPDVLRALTNIKILAILTLSAIMIAINWGVYIWAIQQEQIFQASLGYYINPLMYMLIGVVFLGETLKKLQIFAVILATIGVAVLTIVGGQIPWISLTLAVSFTIYGVIRKQVNVGAMPGLFIETIVLVLPALGYLVWLHNKGALTFMHGDTHLDILLVLAGPITVIPLVAFAFAARRLKLSTLGFLQFIGPSIQFLVGIYYGETLSPARLICFAFIWSAVILFVADALRKPAKPAI